MKLQNDDASPHKILRLRDVLRRTGLSRSTLYIMINKKEFPHQVTLGSRAVGWIEQEVQEWVEMRANLRLMQELGSSPEREFDQGREALKNVSAPKSPQERQRGNRRVSESISGMMSVERGLPDLRQFALVDARLYFDKSTHTFWLHLLPEKSA